MYLKQCESKILFFKQTMAHKNPSIDCPKCSAITIIPVQGTEALSTNNYALTNIELNNIIKNTQ